MDISKNSRFFLCASVYPPCTSWNRSFPRRPGFQPGITSHEGHGGYTAMDIIKIPVLPLCPLCIRRVLRGIVLSPSPRFPAWDNEPRRAWSFTEDTGLWILLKFPFSLCALRVSSVYFVESFFRPFVLSFFRSLPFLPHSGLLRQPLKIVHRLSSNPTVHQRGLLVFMSDTVSCRVPSLVLYPFSKPGLPLAKAASVTVQLSQESIYRLSGTVIALSGLPRCAVAAEH